MILSPDLNLRSAGVEVFEVADLVFAEIGNHVAALEAAFFSRAALGDAGNGEAVGRFAEVGHAAEIRACAGFGAASWRSVASRRLLAFEEGRTSRAFSRFRGDIRHHFYDAAHAGDVDPIVVVTGAVIVAVQAGKKVHHRNLLRIERSVIARTETAGLMRQLERGRFVGRFDPRLELGCGVRALHD